MAKKFVIPNRAGDYPITAPDGKRLESKKEALAYKAKLDAKAAVKPVTSAKAATAPGKAARNDDGDVKLTSQFKDSSGRNVTYDFAGQPGTTVKPQDQLKTNLQTGPQMVTIDGKQTVVIPEGMQNNPGVPTAELQYDPALGQWTVPAGGASGFMTAHPQTPDFSPQLAFALASGGLLGVTAPAVLAGMGAEGAGAATGSGLGGGAGGGAIGAGEGLGLNLGMEGTLGGGLGTAAGGSGLGLATPTLGAGAAGGEFALGSGALSGAGAGAGLTAGGALGGGGSLLSGLGSLASNAGSAVSGLGSSFAPTGNTDLSKLLGALLPAGLGYLGADSQANAMKDIYNQTRADRMPALNAYNSALQNPNTFYQSAPAMGAVDAVLRKLSVNGNPAANPGSLSQAAAYNLGGYNDYLRGLTPAAFGTANTEANVGMNQAGADAGKYNSIGYGLGQYFNPQPNLNDLLKNFSLNIGGVKA
jgi:hypothetical protein